MRKAFRTTIISLTCILALTAQTRDKTWVSDRPVEISRNYFAISKRTNDVYYFGEDVDIYKASKVSSHEGAWLAGVKGARFGLAMPGVPTLKAKYYQELAPGVAMDRAENRQSQRDVKYPGGNVQRRLESCRDDTIGTRCRGS